MVLGAALGGVVGCLYLTDRGRRVRDQIEPSLDAILTELQRARETGAKVREVAREGERTLRGLAGEDRAQEPWPASNIREASS